MMPLWDQNWPHPGGHKLEPKEQRFICGESDSGERSRAIMALLFIFILEFCPEHISKTILAMVMKFCGWMDLIKWDCSADEP